MWTCAIQSVFRQNLTFPARAQTHRGALVLEPTARLDDGKSNRLRSSRPAGTPHVRLPVPPGTGGMLSLKSRPAGLDTSQTCRLTSCSYRTWIAEGAFGAALSERSSEVDRYTSSI